MLNQYYEEEEEEEEGESWLASYSDLVTDLMAVFVLLFSFALLTQGNGKSTAGILDGGTSIMEVGESIVSTYNAQSGEGDSEYNITLPDGAGGQQGIAGGGLNNANGFGGASAQQLAANQRHQERLNTFYESLRAYIEEEGLSDKLAVTKKEGDVVLLRMSDSALFESGRADITKQSEQLLSNIANIFEQYDDVIKMVRIEGHTDNRPINTRQFNSNWELSTSRAVNALRHLLENGVLTPEQFSAVGYSEFYPVAENDTVEGRAKNRRVDFIIETHREAEVGSELSAPKDGA